MKRSKVVVANPPANRPLIIFDGDCGVCRKLARTFTRLSGGRSDYAPYQSVAERYPEVTIIQFEQSVKFIDLSGEVSEGAEASFRAMALVPSLFWRWPLWIYRHLPGARFISELCYRYISTNRRWLSAMTKLFRDKDQKDEIC